MNPYICIPVVQTEPVSRCCRGSPQYCTRSEHMYSLTHFMFMTHAHAVLPVTFIMHALEVLIELEVVNTLGYVNTQVSNEDTNEI